jgi:N-acetylglucosaminyldiphosphoundecaprenol N-acetyl-beta-D-mannosaminyltransferase
MSLNLTSKLADKHLSGGVNTFINPFSYSILRKNIEVVKGVDRILVDGSLMVALLRWLGVINLERRSFDMTSIAPVILHDAICHDKTVCFIGSKSDEVKAAVEAIAKRFPKLNIIYFRDGYFSGQIEWDSEVKLVLDIAPDVVITGLGTPLQEQFLLSLKEKGWKGTGFTCGGFLHQTASSIEYYPKWIDRFNLRWAYRIFDEPKLFWRYFWDYPKSIAFIVWDLKVRLYFEN